MVTFPTGKEGFAVLGYSHIGAGGDDVIVGRLLREILKRGQSARAFLYLIEEEQGFAGKYPLIECELKLSNYPLRVKILLEYPGQGGALHEISRDDVVVLSIRELVDQPRLARLPCAADQERLMVWGGLPLIERFQCCPLESHSLSLS